MQRFSVLNDKTKNSVLSLFDFNTLLIQIFTCEIWASIKDEISSHLSHVKVLYTSV